MSDANIVLSNGKMNRAVIIGGGIGGLLTAKVVSNYYKEVLIVDRDDFPEKPENRSGIPQGYQPHRLTPRGKMIIEGFFPGLSEELLEKGAALTQNKVYRFTNPYGILSMPNSERDLMCSRALLEWGIRQRIKENTNIQFVSKHIVNGLQTSPDQMTVTGIHVKERGQSRRQKVIPADMVIDTSGRQSKLTNWLQELGNKIPAPDVLKVSLGYSTRHYKIPADLDKKWALIHVEGRPIYRENTGIFAMIENNSAEMLIWNAGGNYPSTDAVEYEQAVADLADPIIKKVWENIDPITPPKGYRIKELFRNRFEKMNRWPSGLLVLGDALCNFDPIYGQGMTMAAIEVEVLETCMQNQQINPRLNFERSVLQKFQEEIEPVWWLNCVADLSRPGVEYVGEPLKGVSFCTEIL
ncbi:FAD dependent oxidoreductase [Virgibacillus halophilus]|uniref:FAD dependent oxidoreductase n=1 Tax=Tigheibacillus halophilus TaxID=361280 RepID=A0ABU5C764_9BACI|nr:FAD dependent oxidoreductase [Virgibacillus halophilus]